VRIPQIIEDDEVESEVPPILLFLEVGINLILDIPRLRCNLEQFKPLIPIVNSIEDSEFF
jgi:hypothetical protein